MTVNIEKMRHDIEESRRKADRVQEPAERNQKWETRKFVVSAILATAAAVGAGVGIGNLIWNHPQPPVQLAPYLPGTVITVPAPGTAPMSEIKIEVPGPDFRMSAKATHL